jgi:hypothetical protein
MCLILAKQRCMIPLQPILYLSCENLVHPLSVVDNSDISPTRLTIILDSLYPFFSGTSPFSPFQTARFMMTLQICLFQLVACLFLALALLWRLCWLFLQPSHSQAGSRHTPLYRLLRPRTPLDCPLCRLCSSGVRSVPAPVRPWCEVKSRRGARHPREYGGLRLSQSTVPVLWNH